MYIKTYQLYRVNIYRDEVNKQEILYLISDSWPSVFGMIYEHFGNNTIINSLELLANENINLFIDDSYTLGRIQEAPTVIDGIAKYSHNY